MTTLEIIAYIIFLIAFPFVIQLLTIPLLFLADLLDKLDERRKK